MDIENEYLEILRKLIREMDTRSPVFKVLKEELSLQCYWKNKGRGVPGFKVKNEEST